MHLKFFLQKYKLIIKLVFWSNMLALCEELSLCEEMKVVSKAVGFLSIKNRRLYSDQMLVDDQQKCFTDK